MQLSVQLPKHSGGSMRSSQHLECTHSLDSSTVSALETSSNASCGDCSPSWLFAGAGAEEQEAGSGPLTPAAKCAPAASRQQPQQDKRSAYRRLTLTVPCSSPGATAEQQQQDSSCASSASSGARRVLCTSDSYSSVCSWLEQQVTSRMGGASAASGALIASCSNMVLDLDPLSQDGQACGTPLPAPAFQLLGLL